jgi:diguanylate cyclase (GGDEF)-like protein
MLGLMLLQRGVWSFTAQPLRLRAHGAMLLLAALASWIGADPARRPEQAVVHYTITTTLYLWTAWDMYRHGRRQLQLRWPILLALPLLVAGLNSGGRALRTALNPAALATEIAANSNLNVATALIVVILVATLHATLMALVVGRLVQQLQWRSRHDGLTGLLNRRAMQEAIDQQLARSRRAGDTFAVVMLDLDHFKAINDRYGHPAGDGVLKRVARTLAAHAREEFIIARIGGEEFAVVLPEHKVEQAAEFAERLRIAIGEHDMDATGGGPKHCTVSIGAAEWLAGMTASSELLRAADEQLYRAKQEGRNTVRCTGT